MAFNAEDLKEFLKVPINPEIAKELSDLISYHDEPDLLLDFEPLAHQIDAAKREEWPVIVKCQRNGLYLIGSTITHANYSDGDVNVLAVAYPLVLDFDDEKDIYALHIPQALMPKMIIYGKREGQTLLTRGDVKFVKGRFQKELGDKLQQVYSELSSMRDKKLGEYNSLKGQIDEMERTNPHIQKYLELKTRYEKLTSKGDVTNDPVVAGTERLEMLLPKYSRSLPR